MDIPVYHEYLKIFSVALQRFGFRKIVSKMLNFQFFLPRKQHLLATLSKTRPFISRRYIYLSEQDIDIQN